MMVHGGESSNMKWLDRDITDIYSRFEGLGNNCEFGIVQRKSGLDPLGLFRNAGFLGIDQITAAISTGFAGLFEEGMFSYHQRDGWPQYGLACRVYGFVFHTGIPANVPFPSAEWDRRSTKDIAAFRFLKRKLLEDLAAGEKTFVYRSKQGITGSKARALQAAIASHGPGWLVCVSEDETQPSGVTELVEPGLIRASVRRLSNENPPVIEFEAWEAIARQSLALRFGDVLLPAGWRSPGADTRLSLDPAPPVDGAPVLEHRFTDDTSYGRPPFLYLVEDVAPGYAYMAAAWVYIPGNAKVSDLGIAFLGQQSLRFSKARIDFRDQWQHVFVLCRLDGERGVGVPSLSVKAESGSCVYTCGWEFGRFISLTTQSVGQGTRGSESPGQPSKGITNGFEKLRL